MALYLDNQKVKINLDGITYRLNIISSTLILGGIMLLSSDEYVLKDSSGLYLTAKGDEE